MKALSSSCLSGSFIAPVQRQTIDPESPKDDESKEDQAREWGGGRIRRGWPHDVLKPRQRQDCAANDKNQPEAKTGTAISLQPSAYSFQLRPPAISLAPSNEPRADGCRLMAVG